jgi:hypothetical protein
VDRNTVRKYVAPAAAAGIVPGGEPISPLRWAELVHQWFPELVTTELRHPKFAEIAPYHELIEQMLKTNTVSTVHQRLRDERGLNVSIASFRRYVLATMPDRDSLRGQVTIRKPDPPPGEEAQIDYGYLGQWTDPASGKRRRVWAFVMVLSVSRHLFVRPVVAMPLAAWIEAHVAALEFFGGVPRRLVTDNLKASVITPDLYDPKLNRTYAELAAHYGMLIDPARARKPKDKPRVERPIPYVRDSFFAGREFASLHAMQDAAVTWSLQIAGRRSCRPLGGAQPLAVFQATERPALLALPRQPYELAVWSHPKVHPDIHITVEGRCTRSPGAWWAAPWTPAPLLGWSRCSVRGSWSRPTCVPARAASAPTGATSHPRRSRSWSAPRPGAGNAPPRPAPMSAGWSASCWRATPCTTCAPPRACCALPSATAQTGWTPPALARFRSAIPAIAPSRASLPPGPSTPRWRSNRNCPCRSRRCCVARTRSSATWPSRPPTVTPMTAPTARGGRVTRTHQLEATLRTLKLGGMLDTLEQRLAQARAGELGHLEFLQVLCEDEITRRQTKALRERVRRARFEEPTTLEDFDFSFNPKLPTAAIRDLATCHFIQAGESVILYGPVGVGKTHVAQALGTPPAARGIRSASPRPVGCWPSWPAGTPTTPGRPGCAS